jgi:hypothetical protein
MRFLLLVLALTAAAAPVCAKKAAAQGYSRQAEQVLAEGRSAAGGNGWYVLRGWHETGHVGGVAYERWLDPLRFGLRTETHEAAGLSVEGFNGQGAWKIATPGAAPVTEDAAATAATRADAFFGVYGFYYAARFDAHGEALGVKSTGGKSYDVVAVKPYGGAARELWFDRSSHLLARMIDRNGPKPVTIQLSDYRKLGPVKVAFHTSLQVPGQPSVERQIDALVFAPTDRAMFSLVRTVDTPPPPPGGN